MRKKVEVLAYFSNFVKFKFDCKAEFMRVVQAKLEINKLGWVMTQNWVSQVVSSWGSM